MELELDGVVTRPQWVNRIVTLTKVWESGFTNRIFSFRLNRFRIAKSSFEKNKRICQFKISYICYKATGFIVSKEIFYAEDLHATSLITHGISIIARTCSYLNQCWLITKHTRANNDQERKYINLLLPSNDAKQWQEPMLTQWTIEPWSLDPGL